MIYLGADHAGFYLKEELKKYLEELGHEFEDIGAETLEPKDDYPDYASLVAEKVTGTDNLGILICATGIGMCMAANKVRGVRAANVSDEFTALSSKEHNNANIICLPGKIIDLETAKKIVRIYIETEFTGEERHMRRLDKLKEMEK